MAKKPNHKSRDKKRSKKQDDTSTTQPPTDPYEAIPPVFIKDEDTDEMVFGPVPNREYHEGFMRKAIEMAELALGSDETPVGCVFVKDGEVIGRGINGTNASLNVSLPLALLSLLLCVCLRMLMGGRAHAMPSLLLWLRSWLSTPNLCSRIRICMSPSSRASCAPLRFVSPASEQCTSAA